MPRQTTYSDKVADMICTRIAEGESLRAICRDEGSPSMSMVFRWLNDNAAFREQYARAREAQADAIFDEMLDIANTPMIGEKTKVGSDGKTETTSGDMIEHRRLQIETRKWMASKLQPKKYGDKLDLNVDGKMTLIPQISVNGKSS
jgi:hypothetical protein